MKPIHPLFALAVAVTFPHAARSNPSPPPPPASAQAARAFDFAVYDRLLKQYADADGRVDYAGLRSRERDTIDQLAAGLAQSGPATQPALHPDRNAALAYYLTAYNLLVWKNVVDQNPVRVDDKNYAFFQKPRYRVDGQELSLDDLEKKIIRPRFKDGRIHFALNCASGGCPKLPREAFTPQQVDAQLEREARRFIGEKRNVDLDAASKKLRLSMIFKWYRDDFAKSDAALIAYLNKYRGGPGQPPIPPDVTIEHIEYDWRLNDKTLPSR